MLRVADEVANFRVVDNSFGITRIPFNGALQGPVGYWLVDGTISRNPARLCGFYRLRRLNLAIANHDARLVMSCRRYVFTRV